MNIWVNLKGYFAGHDVTLVGGRATVMRIVDDAYTGC